MKRKRKNERTEASDVSVRKPNNGILYVVCGIVCAAAIVVVFMSYRSASESIVAEAAEEVNDYKQHTYSLYTDALISPMEDDAHRIEAEIAADERADAKAKAEIVTELKDVFDGTLAVDESRVSQSDDGEWVYIIEKGDNLTMLSAAFGYSVDELADVNHIRDVDLIYAESSLRIPCDRVLSE